jgi:putative peptidoglycan lipid II flippase
MRNVGTGAIPQCGGAVADGGGGMRIFRFIRRGDWQTSSHRALTSRNIRVNSRNPRKLFHTTLTAFFQVQEHHGRAANSCVLVFHFQSRFPQTHQPIPPVADDTRKLSTRAAGVVGIAVMCSRVLGLAREMIFNSLFGAGLNLDMFITAFRAPNMLRDLFAEGALSTAFVTTFSKKIATEGDDAAWRLANKIGTLTLVVMSVISFVGVVLCNPLIEVLGSGFHGEDAKTTATLTAVMFPFILMVSLAALVMGMLNAKHVFGWPAMASTFFNVASIIGGVGLGWWFDPHFGRGALMGLAIATLLGGILQFAVQVPSLYRVGFRPRLDFHWRDEGVSAVLRLMAPAVIAASAVQINVLINTSFATHCERGSVTWLNNAFRLMQLPIGIFGVAISTVTLPLLSKIAALGHGGEFRSTLARGMRLAFLLTVPSTIGLILLARPIMSVLYEHGNVTPYQVTQMAAALQFYCIGLCAYSAMKVLTPAFYAIDKRKTPMMISFLAIGSNLVLNWVFTFKMELGHRGLALSTAITATSNFLLQYALMRSHIRRLETRALLVALAKIGGAGIALAAVCGLAHVTVFAGWSRMNFPLRLAALTGTIAVAGVAFFGVAFVMKLDEMNEVVAIFRRRISRVSSAKTTA